MSGGGPTLQRTPVHLTTWPEIPNALRSLWRACLSGEGGDVARALTINFLAVADAAHAESLNAAVERLQQRTPCRAFLLLRTGSAANGSDAREVRLSATTRCHGKVQDIVLERIELQVSGGQFADMPGLLRPLLVNDLPNHLYWGAPWPADERDFDRLAQLCQHAIVDSRRFAEPARQLDLLARRRAQGQRVTDLSWLRLRPWRRALAEAFERFAYRPGTEVGATVRHGTGALAAALLLADWLRERVGAHVELQATADTAAAVPEHVQLKLADVDVELAAKDHRVVVHVTTSAHCYLPFAIAASRGSDGDLLAAAIDVG